MKKIIAYYRCSTRDQHYGIDVQKAQLNEFISKSNGTYELIKEFEENHSGSDKRRIELAKAIDLCKENSYTLCFTKLDRLSRSISHLHEIKEAGIDLICLEMPELNTLTFGIFATIAQHERELISSRTTAALKIVRLNKKLGNPNGWEMNKHKAQSTKNRNKSSWLMSNEVKKAIQIITLTKSKGFASFNEIARNLNIQGIKTFRGKKWQANQVQNLLNSLPENTFLC
jgi:DNA invertase Pin-like site-specific DNA recombinase